MTNAINLPIRDVIQYLYNSYGEILQESLVEERQQVEFLTFNHSLLINIIINQIEKYTVLVEGARSLLTQK